MILCEKCNLPKLPLFEGKCADCQTPEQTRRFNTIVGDDEPPDPEYDPAWDDDIDPIEFNQPEDTQLWE